MKLLLYSVGYPSGRCLALVQQLQKATALTPAECIRLAEQLFDARFTQEQPAAVEIATLECLEEFEATCIGLGITASRTS
jgi:hypothetical protein